MDLPGVVAFVLVMFGLAAMPSASVALVVTRSATLGFRAGVAASAGVVTGDLLFAGMAMGGMVAAADSLGDLFAWMRGLGGAFLIWLGIGLLRRRSRAAVQDAPADRRSLLASYLAGLLLTLGDVKAILFYASLFPSLFDLRDLSMVQAGILMGLTAITVGGVKLAYATTAQTIAIRWWSGQPSPVLQSAAGVLLIAIGATVIVSV